MQSFTISPKKNFKSRFFFAFVLLFGANLFAADANLRDVNIRGDKDSLEILLLLDKTFENRVIKEDSRGFSSIIFKNLNYTKNKLKTKSALIKNIEIFARGNDTYVVLGEGDLDLRFEVSVLNSPNALKIAIKPKIGIAKEMLIKEIPNAIAVDSNANLANPNANLANGGDSNANQSNLGANQSANQSLEDSINALKAQNQLLSPNNSIESWRYALVVAILVGLIIALFIAKKRIALQKDAPNSAFPYFQKPQLRITQSVAIDARNRIVVIASKDAEYIIFVGQNGAFMIDKLPKKRDNDAPKIAKENKIANLLKAYQNANAQNAKIAQDSAVSGESSANKSNESKSSEHSQ